MAKFLGKFNVKLCDSFIAALHFFGNVFLVVHNKMNIMPHRHIFNRFKDQLVFVIAVPCKLRSKSYSEILFNQLDHYSRRFDIRCDVLLEIGYRTEMRYRSGQFVRLIKADKITLFDIFHKDLFL